MSPQILKTRFIPDPLFKVFPKTNLEPPLGSSAGTCPMCYGINSCRHRGDLGGLSSTTATLLTSEITAFPLLGLCRGAYGNLTVLGVLNQADVAESAGLVGLSAKMPECFSDF